MSLRYFNAAGAAFDARLGEDWDRSTMLIPMLMKATLGKRDPVDIYGTDYPTSDGTAIRDFIHVVDLADAHVRALDHAHGGPDLGFLALNLGTGIGSSVKQVITLVEEVAGRPVPLRWSPRRPGDPPQVWADPSLARTTLGWAARHDLRAMVSTAWAGTPATSPTIASTRARRRRRGGRHRPRYASLAGWSGHPPRGTTRSFAAALPSGRRAAATRSAGGSCR